MKNYQRVVDKVFLYNDTKTPKRNFYSMYGLISFLTNDNIYKLYSYTKTLNPKKKDWQIHLLMESPNDQEIHEHSLKIVKEKIKKGYTTFNFDLKHFTSFKQISDYDTIFKNVLTTDLESTKVKTERQKKEKSNKELKQKYNRFLSMDI
jgi:hypothetical protein